jgi:SAM-dependent methyltransferase
VTPYEQQARGDRSAYERYLRGMDSSMKQKVALTAAHLLAQGTIADMGMGSGSGSYALAALYPSLNVVGVDINPTMVEMARERHRLPNLSFICADIAGECFPAGTLDAVFDSSVLHHVTTFNGYDRGAAARALEVQSRQLREHGMLIVRDFVDPGDGDVLLDLSPDDAALFIQFSREFRKLSNSPGFQFEQIDAVRFRVTKTIAAEFVLRKDYRRDWDTEILEEYTYMTQAEFEATFARLGLRIVASIPLWNPWIVRNRFEGKFVMRDLAGEELEFPPTNYLIAGEKVGAVEGVRFE